MANPAQQPQAQPQLYPEESPLPPPPVLSQLSYNNEVAAANYVWLTGHVLWPPQQKLTSTGTQFVQLTLLLSGIPDDKHVIPVSCWGALAQQVAAYAREGDLLYVRGSLSGFRGAMGRNAGVRALEVFHVHNGPPMPQQLPPELAQGEQGGYSADGVAAARRSPRATAASSAANMARLRVLTQRHADGASLAELAAEEGLPPAQLLDSLIAMIDDGQAGAVMDLPRLAADLGFSKGGLSPEEVADAFDAVSTRDNAEYTSDKKIKLKPVREELLARDKTRHVLQQQEAMRDGTKLTYLQLRFIRELLTRDVDWDSLV